MNCYYGVKKKTGPPSAPRHTACKVAKAAQSNCSQKSQNKTTQQKDEGALSDEALDANLKAVDFVLWYEMDRLLSLPFSAENRGPPRWSVVGLY